MSTYPVVHMIEGVPIFEKPVDEIFSELSIGSAIKILSENDYITDAQRRWYKGVCLRKLAAADENGETEAWWDTEVKRLCGGLAYLKKEIFCVEDAFGTKIPMGRLTTKGVGKRKMTAFIEEILSQAMQRGWPIGEPDPALRRQT